MKIRDSVFGARFGRRGAGRPRDTGRIGGPPAAPPPAGEPGSGLARDEASRGPVRDDVSGNGHQRRRRGKGGGKGGAERAMVPPAEFRSYYGRPIGSPTCTPRG